MLYHQGYKGLRPTSQPLKHQSKPHWTTSWPLGNHKLTLGGSRAKQPSCLYKESHMPLLLYLSPHTEIDKNSLSIAKSWC